jgi:hypothetical protein
VGAAGKLEPAFPTGPPPVRVDDPVVTAEVAERCATGNPIEKAKLEKAGTNAWTDVYEFGRAIRAGELAWEDVESHDMNTRLKWCAARGAARGARRFAPTKQHGALRTPSTHTTRVQP